MTRLMMAAFSVVVFSPAHADVVDDVLKIRYEGTVSSVEGTALDYAVGDHVSGRLLVDLRRAPPDSAPNPREGGYRNDFAGGDSGFVTGGAPPRSGSGDVVSVVDDIGNGLDFFGATDDEFGFSPLADGRRKYRQDAAEVLVQRDSNFIVGEGLVQSFDFSGADVGLGRFSKAREVYDDKGPVRGTLIGGIVEFVLQRITVTPGHCSP